MNDPLLQEESVDTRVQWLMLSRVAIVTFLLGITTFIKVQKTELLPEISLEPLYIIFTLTYVLSIGYLFFLNFFKSLKLNIYIQTLTDVVLITGLVYATGGIRSIYSVFYPLVIIYSVLFLGKGGGLIIASACSILYGLLLDLEYYGIILPLHTLAVHDYDFGAGYVFSRIFIHMLSFYIIALLASFVVEREKRVRILLAQKETAFDQLDLLHRSIIESVDTGILTINLQGRIKSFNGAAEDITGLTFTEVENKNIAKIFPGFARILDKTGKEDYKSSTINRYNVEFVGKDKLDLVLGCSISSLKNNIGKRIGDILIFHDLTSITKMEKALEKSRRLAIIGEMSAGLAHEMRNPLASISGSIQILKKDLALHADDERLMKIILRGKDQLENIIKDFLLLARPAPGDQETIFINEIIEDVMEAIQYVPDWHDDIKVFLSVSENLNIKANRKEMRELMWNLILNAIQAMPDGGNLSIKTEKKYQDVSNEYLQIRVMDTGDGIDEENLNNIFEPFFTTKDAGTGLGLAIVNRIVEEYAGHISIEKNVNNGTIFTVSLPLHQ